MSSSVFQPSRIAVGLLIVAIAWVAGWGCGADPSALVPYATSGAPAVLQLRVKRPPAAPEGADGQHAVATSIPALAVKLVVQVGRPTDPDVVNPPEFDISGPAGETREVAVVNIPPGRGKRVGLQGKDASGRVVFTAEFLADFVPGTITTNDVDLAGLGAVNTGVVVTVTTATFPVFDLVVSESGTNVLSRVRSTGQGTTARTVLFSFTSGTTPLFLARDASGNIVVAEFGSGVPPGPTPTSMPPALSLISPAGVRTVLNTNPVGNPNAVAINAAGQFFVTDPVSDVIRRVPAGGGMPAFVSSFGVGEAPKGIAIDAAGNLIVCLAGSPMTSNALVRIPQIGSPVTPIFNYNTGAPGFSPRSVLIDANGDFIVGEQGSGTSNLARITPGGARTVFYTFAGSDPGQIVRTSAGNFQFAEGSNQVLVEVSPAGGRIVLFTFAAGTDPEGLLPQ
jgi:hypothetical protein